MTHCHRCDLPRATQEDHDTLPGGAGAHLCWAEWGTPCETFDWRAFAVRVARGYLGSGPRTDHADHERLYRLARDADGWLRRKEHR